MLPPRFDYQFYMEDKAFLSSETEAQVHFENKGVPTGLAGSPACDQGFFVRLINRLRPGSILEIGPGCSPKIHGSNVKYFDVKSGEELRSRYADSPSLENIPEILHYTDDEGDLRTVRDKFDVVFSSHMIEHSLDLIEHINSVEALLNHGGYYFIIAPNKNYTFDYFKPVSLSEDVIAHHIECGGKPSLSIRSVLLEKCRRTHNDVTRHWSGDHGEQEFNSKNVLRAVENFEQMNENHVACSGFHSWIFSDHSFANLIRELHELKMISLKLNACYNTPFGSCSFNAVLRR